MIFVSKGMRLIHGLVHFFMIFDVDFYCKNRYIENRQSKIYLIKDFIKNSEVFGNDIASHIDSDWIREQYRNVGKEYSRLESTIRFLSFGYRNNMRPNAIINYNQEKFFKRKFFLTKSKVNITSLNHRHKNVTFKKIYEIENDYMNSIKTSLVIFIPVFGNYYLLKYCIRQLGVIPKNVKVFVVNDGFKDAIPEYFVTKYPQIVFENSTENLGFLERVNSFKNQINNFEYVMLLNSDAFLEDGFFEKIDLALENYNGQNVSIFGIKSLSVDGLVLEHSSIVTENGKAKWNYNGLEMDLDFLKSDITSQYVSGNAIIIKSKLILDRGSFFDSRFSPAYYEDTDLCFYARSKGQSAIALGNISCIHLVSKTFNSNDESLNKKLLMEINQIKFQKKWAEMLIEDQKIIENNNIWWIDDTFPFSDKDAGNFRNNTLVHGLLESRKKVWWISTKGDLNRRDLSVNCQSLFSKGLNYSNNLEKLIEDAYSNLWMKPGIIVISRYDNYLKYNEMIRLFFPKVKIIFDYQDLHGLRKLKESRVLNLSTDYAQKISDYEIAIDRNNPGCLFISQEERDAVGSVSSNIVSIPEEFDSSFNFESRKDLILFANFHHPPNLDGVEFFLNNIWDNQIKTSKINSLNIAGWGIELIDPNIVRKFKNVKILGHIKNIDEEIKKHFLSVSFLRYGGGVKGKVIKSYAKFVPVIGSNESFSGIPAMPYKDKIVFEDKFTFNKVIEELSFSADLYEEIAVTNQSYFKNLFDAELIVRDFLHIIDQNLELNFKSFNIS